MPFAGCFSVSLLCLFPLGLPFPFFSLIVFGTFYGLGHTVVRRHRLTVECIYSLFVMLGLGFLESSVRLHREQPRLALRVTLPTPLRSFLLHE